MASQFKEFKVKVTVDTKDGNKQIEKTINNLEEYEKILDDLNKKKVKPGITPQELAAIDKEIVELGNAFGKAGNKILLVNQDLEVTAKNLKALQKEQKTFAVGSDEYRKAADKIADFKDKLEGAKRTQIGLGEQLEAAPGPLGMFFSGIDKVKNSFTTLGGAIKASGIGLLVSIIGGITAAFAGNEKATKKLQPLLIGMEKIFNGLYRVFEPLLDAFMDMANVALPYIMEGIGMFYSGLVALFTLLKEVISQLILAIFFQISFAKIVGTKAPSLGKLPIRITTIFSDGITKTYCPFLPIPANKSAGASGNK
jgi:flagellar biosynthesis chaperone FliJ